MLPKVKYYIDKLELKKHREGGYFKETYRSDEIGRASCRERV